MVMLGDIEADKATLEALSLLAGNTSAEISGMFIEDIELLSLAELPIAREYCRLTHAERRLQSPDIERQLRVQARAAQRALAEVAARLGSPLSFRIVRGALPALLREALEETDLMLFSTVRATLRTPGASGRASTSGPLRRPVAVVFDGSEASRRALKVALQLATIGVTPLSVVLTALNSEDLSSLSDEVAGLAPDRTLQLVELVHPAWRDVLEWVQAHRSSALVIAITTELLQDENLGQLRTALGCPTILVK
jgi:nucleotide-binding universal stress UspA family protein